MKREIINDLVSLISIIKQEPQLGRYIDISPLEGAVNTLTQNPNAYYSITGLTFLIDKKIKYVKPDVDKFSIVINNTVHYMNNDNEVSIGAYKLDLLICGFKGSDKYKFCWHLDKHTTRGLNRYTHPIFHFQAGGQLTDLTLDNSKRLYIGSPRIPHPPMDIFLVVNFIFHNFYDNKVYPFVNSLLSNPQYCAIIKRAQSRILDPYIIGYSNSTAHNDYRMDTIFPLYIR